MYVQQSLYATLNYIQLPLIKLTHSKQQFRVCKAVIPPQSTLSSDSFNLINLITNRIIIIC